MKTITFIFALATTLAACNNSPQTDPLLKEQVLKQVRDSIRLDSFNRAEAEELKMAEEKKQAALQHSAVSGSSSSKSEPTYVKGVSETYTNSQPAKKGWSKAAKGAAIGAGVGAVTGVIVDKKDGRGAVIGGLAGAGAGYVIGRSKDKKDGRVQE